MQKMSVLRLSPKHVKAPERSPRSGNVARSQTCVEKKTMRRASFSKPHKMAGYNLELLAIAYATGNGPVMTRNPQCESAGDAAVLHTNCDNVCAQAELGNRMEYSKDANNP